MKEALVKVHRTLVEVKHHCESIDSDRITLRQRKPKSRNKAQRKKALTDTLAARTPPASAQQGQLSRAKWLVYREDLPVT